MPVRSGSDCPFHYPGREEKGGSFHFSVVSVQSDVPPKLKTENFPVVMRKARIRTLISSAERTALAVRSGQPYPVPSVLDQLHRQ